MVLLDVSPNNFLRKLNFDYFDLVPFKHLSCKISDFQQLLIHFVLAALVTFQEIFTTWIF